MSRAVGIADALSAWCSERLGTLVKVLRIDRVEGGWSRQLHRVVLCDTEGQELVIALRGELAVSVIQSDLAREYAILTVVAASDVPVPDIVGFESIGDVIGHRFIAMPWVAGTSINPWRRGAADILGDVLTRAGLADAWIEDIARLHALDVEGLRRSGVDPDLDADRYLVREVESWVGILRKADRHPGPLVEEACCWLEANRPSGGAPAAIVHGDLRIGNMLVDGARVVAFLDWEMAGIGDWRADIGYSLMPYHAGKLLSPVPPSANLLVHPRRFLDRYASTTGRSMPDDELSWFIVLGCVKMIAILCTGIDSHAAGRTVDPRLAWTSIAIPGLVTDMCGLIEDGLPW